MPLYICIPIATAEATIVSISDVASSSISSTQDVSDTEIISVFPEILDGE